MTGLVFSLTDIAIPVILGLFSFFAIQVLAILRLVRDLHTWHSKTDPTGAFLWYAHDKQIIEILGDIQAHIAAEDKVIQQVLVEIAAVKIEIQRMNGKAR